MGIIIHLNLISTNFIINLQKILKFALILSVFQFIIPLIY